MYNRVYSDCDIMGFVEHLDYDRDILDKDEYVTIWRYYHKYVYASGVVRPLLVFWSKFIMHIE